MGILLYEVSKGVMIMPELRCNVHSCVHNKNMYCALDQIEVGGREAKTSKETSCKSFAERKEGTYSNSMKEASAKTAIDCQATTCTYNESCKCQAGKIDVSGNDACKVDETCCSSFECKN